MGTREQSMQFAGGILGQHRHICAFFNSVEEEHRVLRSFIKDGFDGGERAFHIVDPDQVKEHLSWLGETGINVERVMGTGQLRVCPWQEAYLREDRFDQDVGKAACDVARLAPYPRHRQSGNRQQIPQRRSQPQDLAVGFHLHSARHCALARRLPLANLAQKLVRRNEERILVH